jgi:hypothetical protein
VNKNHKIVFFDCDWFDPNHGTRENQFGMVEVKHVHRQRGCSPFILAHQVEQVYYNSNTPDDSDYHENQVAAGEVDEIYQDDEFSCSFNIDLDLALNSLLGDANNVTVPEQKKQALRKKKKHKILNILYISYYVLYIFILYSCYFLLRSLYFTLYFL